MKLLLKMLVLFIISTTIVYLIFTIIDFKGWCDKNQISMYLNSDKLLVTLDSTKIQELGDEIALLTERMENSINETYEGNSHSLAEYYDPLGYNVWLYMQNGISMVLTNSISISILLGIGITIAYTIITNKKISNVNKFLVGYLGTMIIIPIVYVYIKTHKILGMFNHYFGMLKYFYIVYTLIFILIYIINYKIGRQMTKELNKNIKDN